MTIVVQVNGKLRGADRPCRSATEEDAVAEAKRQRARSAVH